MKKKIKCVYVHMQFIKNNTIKKIVPNESLLSSWFNSFLKPKYKPYKDIVFNIRFVEYKEIIGLNSYYRGFNSLTNIISFSYEALSQRINIQLLGELVITPTLLLYESFKMNKAFIDHCAHIIVHGLLHLIGYNHKNVTDADNMENIEYSNLNKTNIHL